MAKGTKKKNKQKRKVTPSGARAQPQAGAGADAAQAARVRAKNNMMMSRVAVGIGGAAGVASSKLVGKLHRWSDENDKRIHIPKTRIGYITAAGTILGGVSLLSKSPYALGVASFLFANASADSGITEFRGDDITTD